ncbi:3-phosphoshikimate 1-carboxyvinyltransferase [Paenibacillus sp. HB172176]|uniref:3-phosphoshikimate 1-carboxyvinyltransferase n=1 Tax=Paenibacillus sp. HB172176 TaxID=2493690 RepID=UPI001F11778B|nr:3-phosphoshikimate 1-carboxyvinyltransferase [Paenibacillus sp. HB172176]
MHFKPSIPDKQARSPWASRQRKAVAIEYDRAKPFHHAIRIPGSKSLTNRALIMAAMAEGITKLDGILRSDDSYWCIDCLTRLGIPIKLDGDSVQLEGCGGRWPNRKGSFYVGAAGTAARFLPPSLAAGEGEWLISGSMRLQERPMAPLLGALSSLGATFDYSGLPNSLPFKLTANGLRGGEVSIPGSTSSQFLSGLLMAAPYAKKPLTIRLEDELVQQEYVRMTIDMMEAFGIVPKLSIQGNAIAGIEVPQGSYQGRRLQLEPDISTCGYFWALAALTNGRITIDGLAIGSTRQPDKELLAILERMGCTVVRGDSFVEVRGTGKLKGGFVHSMRACSDQLLTVAVMAVFADAPITLTDAAHIRMHECDRIAAICAELTKLGIRADEHQDGVTVYPGTPQAASLDTHDDHRMAMALSLLSARVSGIRLIDPGCVSKTCPDYFERLRELGFTMVYEDELVEED